MLFVYALLFASFVTTVAFNYSMITKYSSASCFINKSMRIYLDRLELCTYKDAIIRLNSAPTSSNYHCEVFNIGSTYTFLHDASFEFLFSR